MFAWTLALFSLTFYDSCVCSCVSFCRYSAAKGTTMAFLMTFSDLFDVPVFWPILLGYFLLLFGITMKTRVEHMRKHGYVPWSLGKKKYAGAAAAPRKDSK
jgi:hypothetical protein